MFGPVSTTICASVDDRCRVVRHERARGQRRARPPDGGRRGSRSRHSSSSDGPDVAVARRGLGQRAGDVELGDDARPSRAPAAPPRATCAQTWRKIAVSSSCARSFALQDLRLVLAQLRRRVALGVDQRLPALVVLRARGRVRLADLDVVAEDAVVADLQRLDAVRSRSPASSSARKRRTSRVISRRRSSSSENPGANDVAGVERRAGLVGDRLRDRGDNVVAVSELRRKRCRYADRSSPECLAQLRDRLEPAAQRDELARLRRCPPTTRPTMRSRSGTLRKQVAQAAAPQRAVVARTRLHRDAARSLRCRQSGWPRRRRSRRAPIAVLVRSSVCEQRAFAALVAPGGEQLEVAHRVRVEADVLAGAMRAERGDERDARGLVLAQVHQDGAARHRPRRRRGRGRTPQATRRGSALAA